MQTEKRRKIVVAAREAFLRYGYRRVSMGELAMAAGISRPALYLVFRNKEEIFKAVFDDWVDRTIEDIERLLPTLASPRERVLMILELWAVRPFELVLDSSDARELLECTFEFARPTQDAAYARLEALLAPPIGLLLKGSSRKAGPTAARAAHVLVGAVRGFKQVAANSRELRRSIKDLLTLWLD